jgi:large subunit ribosomal protein L5
MSTESRLKKEYNERIKKELMDELEIKNASAVPTLEKIVLNVGLGAAKDDPKALEDMAKDIAAIAGQKPVITKSKKAISNFKIRENQEIGIKVTLRGRRMWDFFDKLVSITLPRVKDFRGVSNKAFDGRGNYALGVREHTIFVEVDSANVTKLRSMQVIINTTADDNIKAKALLQKLGMPFRHETKKAMQAEALVEEAKEEAEEKAAEDAKPKEMIQVDNS